MLTTKEVQFLKENIENENLLITKFGSYSQQAADPTIKQLCCDIRNLHKQNIDCLSKQLSL
jgi:hypothetical protein